MRFELVLFSLLLSFISFSQIIIDEENDDVTVTSNNKESAYKEICEIYFGFNPTYTYRTLKENEGLFGKELGSLEEEDGAVVASFNLGFRNSISNHFLFDIGVGFTRDREYYIIEEPDTLFEYTNTYQHIGFPIKLAFTSGEDIAFFMGVGLTPKAFISKRIDLRFKEPSGFEKEEKITERNRHNFVLLDLSASIGVRFKADPKYGIYIFGEGFHQLTNTYNNQAPHIRKAFGAGIHIGFHYFL